MTSTFFALARPSALIFVILLTISFSSQTSKAQPLEMVSLRSHQALAEHVGEENENWQPAFQAALKEARDSGKPLYVPPGTYRIRSAIAIEHGGNLKEFLNPQKVSLIGAGPQHSIIQQMDPTANVLDWSGPTYQESYSGGSIRDLAIVGGDIGLNLKWHNYFRMNNCYVAGAHRYGIYTEGWSSRFSDSIVRWCRQAGFYGRAHANDIKIDGFYFSRNGIGIRLTGSNGIFISDSGFEHNARSAIYIEHTSHPVISSCYFECNGHRRGPAFLNDGPGYPNVIHLDGLTNSAVIQNNIFRESLEEANMIGIVACEGARIIGNKFSNARAAIRFLDKSHVEAASPQLATTKNLYIRENTFEVRNNVLRLGAKVEDFQFIAESAPGLIERARQQRSIIEEPTLVMGVRHNDD